MKSQSDRSFRLRDWSPHAFKGDAEQALKDVSRLIATARRLAGDDQHEQLVSGSSLEDCKTSAAMPSRATCRQCEETPEVEDWSLQQFIPRLPSLLGAPTGLSSVRRLCCVTPCPNGARQPRDNGFARFLSGRLHIGTARWSRRFDLDGFYLQSRDLATEISTWRAQRSTGQSRALTLLAFGSRAHQSCISALQAMPSDFWLEPFFVSGEIVESDGFHRDIWGPRDEVVSELEHPGRICRDASKLLDKLDHLVNRHRVLALSLTLHAAWPGRITLLSLGPGADHELERWLGCLPARRCPTRGPQVGTPFNAAVRRLLNLGETSFASTRPDVWLLGCIQGTPDPSDVRTLERLVRSRRKATPPSLPRATPPRPAVQVEMAPSVHAWLPADSPSSSTSLPSWFRQESPVGLPGPMAHDRSADTSPGCSQDEAPAAEDVESHSLPSTPGMSMRPEAGERMPYEKQWVHAICSDAPEEPGNCEDELVEQIVPDVAMNSPRFGADCDETDSLVLSFLASEASSRRVSLSGSSKDTRNDHILHEAAAAPQLSQDASGTLVVKPPSPTRASCSSENPQASLNASFSEQVFRGQHSNCLHPIASSEILYTGDESPQARNGRKAEVSNEGCFFVDMTDDLSIEHDSQEGLSGTRGFARSLAGAFSAGRNMAKQEQAGQTAVVDEGTRRDVERWQRILAREASKYVDASESAENSLLDAEHISDATPE